MAKEKACSNKNSSKGWPQAIANDAARHPRQAPGAHPSVLLRLTSSLWLVRAAVTCRRWLHIITHRNFLVAIDRSPHPVVGHYH
ncbi:hypothetical protein E2562_031368 [Oryza meyeriana var. granulata]|uniref:F-box domain-containing protein n=1 Tax=Oryza meyeriana var. granulata TaxID=110450 RepID=A0A6G1DQM0_9ORYZ|nr:hypothetical protein E2562_031368 [Oryza meyeriana var. granulata]